MQPCMTRRACARGCRGDAKALNRWRTPDPVRSRSDFDGYDVTVRKGQRLLDPEIDLQAEALTGVDPGHAVHFRYVEDHQAVEYRLDTFELAPRFIRTDLKIATLQLVRVPVKDRADLGAREFLAGAEAHFILVLVPAQVIETG